MSHYPESVILLLSAANPPIDWQHARPGYAGLIVVIILFVAMVFLVRSFLKHARKAREPWDGETDPDVDADGN
jgi:hypothetical protein